MRALDCSELAGYLRQLAPNSAETLGLGPDRLLALGQDYAGLSVLARTGDGWRLRLLNQLPTLPSPSRG